MTTAALFGAPDAVLAQASQDAWKRELQEAHQLAISGRIAEAAERYQNAAEAAPRDDERAEILVELGVLYARQASQKSPGSAALERSAAAFRQAMELARGSVRWKATNNYAAQLLRLGRDTEAAKLLGEALTQIRNAGVDDPLASSRTLYNYGRALVQIGDARGAADAYWRAYRADPRFEPAREAVIQAALQSPSESTGVPELVRLTDDLIERGDLESAARSLKEGLAIEHWKQHSEFPRLVEQTVRLLSVSQVSPEEYAEVWRRDITGASRNAHRAAAVRLEDVDRTYTEPMPATFDQWEARDRFRGWDAPGGYELLSAFLKMVGDHYFRGDSSQRALELYSNAWSVDTTNMDAGLYLANVLTSTSQRIDPDHEHLDRFLRFAFDEKAKAYLGEDWASILKFHTVLGTLFERLGAWGPPYSARSAYFQWKHALRAHERLAERDPSVPRAVPSIHEHFARALAGVGDLRDAWGEYLTAAELYLDLARPDEAEAALEAAQGVDHVPDAAEKRRLERLRALLTRTL